MASKLGLFGKIIIKPVHLSAFSTFNKLCEVNITGLLPDPILRGDIRVDAALAKSAQT
jgi:hypothetical protein